MDTDQEDTRLEQLRTALRGFKEYRRDTTTQSIHDEQLNLDFGRVGLGVGEADVWSIDNIPSLTTDHITTLDLSSLSINNLNNSPIYTSSGASPSWSFSDLSNDHRPAGKISLTGDDADIEINGESVVGMLRDIRDQLAILRVSEEMEAEWDELRELRQQYEAKLAECREKSAMWKTLKNMPPPEIT